MLEVTLRVPSRSFRPYLQRRNRKAARYLVEKVPHQFKDAQQYERSMRMPIGADWNTVITHNKAIQPKVPRLSLVSLSLALWACVHFRVCLCLCLFVCA